MLIFNVILTLINIFCFLGYQVVTHNSKFTVTDTTNPQYDFSVMTEEDLTEFARIMNAESIQPKRAL
jgi:hypothetical protein